MTDPLRAVFGADPATHLADWREAAVKDLAAGKPFSAHPAAIIAILDALAADTARPGLTRYSLEPYATDALRPDPEGEWVRAADPARPGLDVEALLAELSESPLPGARYAYTVVKRRLSEKRP